MKKNKSLLVSSLILSVLVLSPVASFAQDNNRDGLKVKQNNSIKLDKDDKHSSFSNKFSNWFGSRAKVEAKVNANIRPNISSIKAPTVLKTGEVGTWSIKANDPQNGTLEYSVDWGDSSNMNTLSKMLQKSFSQTSTFTHAYTSKGTYKITFTVSNDAGQKATSTTTVQVVGNETVKNPVISNLEVSSVKAHKAKINWDTDVKSNSSVWYSKTSPVSTGGKANVFRKARVLDHKIVLSKLDANTKYYVIVKSANNSGGAQSSEISFTTLATNETAPVITNISGPTSIKEGETATVTVNAYDPQNGTLEYTADWGDTVSLARALTGTATVQSSTFTHVYSSAGTYTAKFTVKDSEGKEDSASIKIVVTSTEVDTTKPIITDKKTFTGSTSSTISWKTDEPSTSEVYYSTLTPLDVNAGTTLAVKNQSLVTNHSLDISPLASGTIYHFIIKSADASNNIAISGESSLITN